MAAPRPATIIAAILASASLSIPLIEKWEGKVNDPYRDIAGIETVCYGQTKTKMKHYTDAECKKMLKESNDQYAADVLALSPTLIDKPKILAATTSLSYNIGVENYKKSNTRKMFALGRYKEGCDLILSWNKVTINGKKVVSKGLVNRRMDEHSLCIEGVKDATENSVRSS